MTSFARFSTGQMYSCYWCRKWQNSDGRKTHIS